MRLELSIAEFARKNADGTITAVRMGIDRFFTPAASPRELRMSSYVVAMCSCDIEDAGHQIMVVSVINDHGESAVPEFRCEFDFAGGFSNDAIAIPFTSVLPLGSYEVRFTLNGELKATCPFTVQMGDAETEDR